MGFRFNLLPGLLLQLLLFAAMASSAFADNPHDRTQFGRDITVGAGEEVMEATCFGCSIHVRGHVGSDVTTFGGSIVVEDQGEVSGDTTAFGGDVRVGKGAKVRDVTVFGGHVRRDPAAMLAGDVTNFSGSGWLLVIFALPLVFLGAFIALIVWVVRLLTRPALPAAV